MMSSRYYPDNVYAMSYQLTVILLVTGFKLTELVLIKGFIILAIKIMNQRGCSTFHSFDFCERAVQLSRSRDPSKTISGMLVKIRFRCSCNDIIDGMVYLDMTVAPVMKPRFALPKLLYICFGCFSNHKNQYNACSSRCGCKNAFL